MRRLAEAVRPAALGGERAAEEIIRFDVVLDLPG
jgi:hypothetical protein